MVLGRQTGFQVVGGSRTDGLLDALVIAGLGGFHHDHPAYAVAALQLGFQFQVQALQAHHRDLHHAFLQRPAQGAADKGLGQVQLRGNLGLLEPFFVIEARDLGDQALFFDLAHEGLRALYSKRHDTMAVRIPNPYDMIRPPSILIAWPVRYAASSEARNATKPATSEGLPARRRGMFLTHSAINSPLP